MISGGNDYPHEKDLIWKAWISRSLSLFIVQLTLCWTSVAQVNPAINNIEILNSGKDVPYRRTNIDAGPSHGDILNYHYFPALQLYRRGRFYNARNDLQYLIERPQYLKMNPRQAEFLSNSHYMRGMIYLYHASGPGRHVLAKRDFEESIRWNPKNYMSYLELSHAFVSVGMKAQAISVLRRLLELNPDESVATQAKKELSSWQSGKVDPQQPNSN